MFGSAKQTKFNTAYFRADGRSHHGPAPVAGVEWMWRSKYDRTFSKQSRVTAVTEDLFAATGERF